MMRRCTSLFRSTSARTRTITGLTLAFATGYGVSYYTITPSRPSLSTLPGVSGSIFSPHKKNIPQSGDSTIVAELIEALGEAKVSTDEDDLHAHGFSPNHYHPGHAYDIVVYPASTADVVKIVNLSRKYLIPVVPYSGGTNLEGHTVAHSGPNTQRSICIDMSSMDSILAVHPEDGDATVQAGVKWMDLNSHLKAQGIPLFLPLDPAPGATVGGMLSTGCSGTNAVRYGTARQGWFLNATVVLPDGSVINTRGRNLNDKSGEGGLRRVRKSSAGWDTTQLFIGAEGTLGIVTEVSVRLAPVLKTNVVTVAFPDVKKATEASVEIMQKGVGIQCIELVDAEFMVAANAFNGPSGRHYPLRDSLFLKLQGPTDASLADTAKVVKEVAAKHGATNWTLARNQKEAEEIWSDRKNAHYSGLFWGQLGKEGKNIKGWSTDVCVPVSRLPDLVALTKADLDSLSPKIKTTIVGHIGDGNFHSLLLFDEDNEDEVRVAKEAVKRVVKRALELDGTCTGEHGVGIGKRAYLVEELGEGTVELMKQIKRTIDPHGLFNPGKLYPDDPLPRKEGKR